MMIGITIFIIFFITTYFRKPSDDLTFATHTIGTVDIKHIALTL